MARRLTVHTVRPNGWNDVAAFTGALRELFTRFATGITFVEGTAHVVGDNSLDEVRIDGCQGSPTQDVESLFATVAADMKPGTDFAVFFARALSDATGPTTMTGCANHPPQTRGVIVRCQSRPVNLPHEVCHLFGLEHVDDPENRNLMVPDPEHLVGDGLLVPAQVETIVATFGGMVPFTMEEVRGVVTVAGLRHRRARKGAPPRRARKRATPESTHPKPRARKPLRKQGRGDQTKRRSTNRRPRGSGPKR